MTPPRGAARITAAKALHKNLFTFTLYTLFPPIRPCERTHTERKMIIKAAKRADRRIINCIIFRCDFQLSPSKYSDINVHKFINSKEVVDANSLLRSAFENLIMGMMINESEDTYKEFINLSIDDTTRQYTKPQKLRNDFRKVLRKLDGDLFIDMNSRDLKDFLDEFYDKMCLFTHSTILVNAMIEIEKDDDLDIYVVALKQNTYFVELLLYLCLKYLCNYKKDPIDITYLLLGWYVLISDVPKEKITPEKMEKLNKLLYADFNKEYLEKNKEIVDFLTEEAKKLQEDIQKNPTGFVELLTSLVK